MKKWNQKFYINRPLRRKRKKKSLTKTKIFEYIAMLLVVCCLVLVAAAAIFIALVGIFKLFWLF